MLNNKSKSTINYLPQKKASQDDVSRYLDISSSLNWYTNNGPVKKILESQLADLLKLDADKSVICTNSGTSALHTIMLYCKNKLGANTWVTPSFTFPSVVMATGMDVTVMDIDPLTKTLPLNESLLNPFDGIILTNLFGSFVDINNWVSFCKKMDKVLIFDNASSPLSTYQSKTLCNFGTFSFGSLHHTKYLGFGEGGYIVAPKEIKEDIQPVTNFGFHGSRKFHPLSSNFKMSDIAASYILAHIKSLNLKKYIDIQQHFIDNVLTVPNIELFNYQPTIVYNNLPILFESPITEDVFFETGISVGKYYYPLNDNHPHSNDLYQRIINFPLHSDLTLSDIDHIVSAIQTI